MDSAREIGRQNPPADCRELSGARVLVIDDSHDMRLMLSNFVERAGADVVSVCDGEAAVELVGKAINARESFDVVLTDLHMPVMDGWQTARMIRNLGFAGLLIAISAETRESWQAKSLSAGCDAFLLKPFDRRQLLALIDQCFSVLSTTERCSSTA